MSKLFWVIVMGCLIGNSAVAQEPTKAEPAHYRLAFENDRVQVVYIHYGPHEQSGLHEHPAGVVVNVTQGRLRFTDQNGKTQEVFAKPGEARWFPPFRHRVENLSDTTYDGVYIGVKNKPSISVSKLEPPSNGEIEKIANAYVLTSSKRD